MPPTHEVLQPASSSPRSPSTAGGTGPGGLDGFFRISERGSTVAREFRGGLATFFTMAYIVVLNPIILGSGVDKFGQKLSVGQLTTATALVAAVMTLIMGVGGNLPLAIASGLGLNAVVAFQLAPQMSWPDAMGLVVIEGLGICILVATGARQAIMDAIPMALKQSISVGIGLFIAFIGFVDSGFVSRIPDAASSTVPVQLGLTGRLTGWPVVVFCLGVLLTLALLVRRVKGAILLSIIAMTILAVIIEALATIKSWGLTTPKYKGIVGKPDFGLFGHFSLFGAVTHVGVLTAVIFAFTLILSDFFDAMGTIIGVTNEAGLLDRTGRLPGIGRVLFIDGLAASAGGIASASSNTCFIESAAGVGEGARTGLANVFTAAFFVVALFLTPLTTIVPSQAASPALVAVGFLLMQQVKDIPWDEWDIAIPAFLTIVLMPFSYSITNGIGAGMISYALFKLVRGRAGEVHVLVWVVAILFAIYFALNPITQWLGIS
ncbi:MAG TPA: NCS2 family permease [Kineosporiaceae bacterium]|jgi:AGZA family xanthine/uracil permease-like MFS transporter|nr:NCS2 family permease [Kineosporiaceae bacterium]